MNKLCSALFKCENIQKIGRENYNFEVHSNERASRKSGHLGLDQVQMETVGVSDRLEHN